MIRSRPAPIQFLLSVFAGLGGFARNVLNSKRCALAQGVTSRSEPFRSRSEPFRSHSELLRSHSKPFRSLFGPLRSRSEPLRSHLELFRSHLELLRSYLELFRSHFEPFRSYFEPFRSHFEPLRWRCQPFKPSGFSGLRGFCGIRCVFLQEAEAVPVLGSETLIPDFRVPPVSIDGLTFT